MPAVSQLLTFTLKDESHINKHELEELQTVWRIEIWSSALKKKKKKLSNWKWWVPCTVLLSEHTIQPQYGRLFFFFLFRFLWVNDEDLVHPA